MTGDRAPTPTRPGPTASSRSSSSHTSVSFALPDADAVRPDQRWTILGAIGTPASNAMEGRSRLAGHGHDIGTPVTRPTGAFSPDAVAREVPTDLRALIDTDPPGLHPCGTDIVRTARAGGCPGSSVDLPVVHNGVPARRLDAPHGRDDRPLARKRPDDLPLPTSGLPVERSGRRVARPCARLAWEQLVRRADIAEVQG